MIQKKYLILIAVSGLIIVLDQASKLYVHTHFNLHESIPVLDDFFNFTYVRNKGAAFGMLRDAHETFRNLFFLSIPPIAVFIILMILRGVKNEQTAQILALTGVFGGAIGNYIDRLRFGYVIDFLDFHLKNYYTWPAFNIADSTIVVGVLVLIWIMFQEGREEMKAKKKAKAS